MRKIEKPSLQSLLLKMRFNGQELSSGTGFIVNTESCPVLVTNRHNVTGRHQETGALLSDLGAIPNEIAITHNAISDREAVGQILYGNYVECIEPLFDANENPRWREHPTLGSRADFVALPLTQLENVSLYPYNVSKDGPDIALGPTEIVSVIGFPFGKAAGSNFGIWATGFIASEPDVDYLGLPVMLIDCRSRPGQSGSPVIAYRGDGLVSSKGAPLTIYDGPVHKFIGIYSGRISKESDIGMVWKAEAIRELIDTFNPTGWRNLALGWTSHRSST